MRIVIIEDEQFAARRLENMIREYDASIEVVARLESVRESIEWFRSNPSPDLIFLDIHLEDNLSFAIFESVTITSPIVFTTATDELSTRAFISKKIDYLLKPIIRSELIQMIEKYRNLAKEEHKIVSAGFFKDIINKKK
jgi:two-component system, LytTR family, response regulator LytT